MLDTFLVNFFDNMMAYRATATKILIIKPSNTKCWRTGTFGNKLKIQLQATAIAPYITKAVW